MSSAFAVSGGDKFADRDWHRSPTGLPVLDGAIAWLECAIVRVVEAGDHWFVLARVVDLAAMRGRRPLVFFLGGYTGLTR